MWPLNPLVREYEKRLDRHHSVARGAYELLRTCVHEAGHWLAYTHYRVFVCTAYVDRRPGKIGRGCVIPADLATLIDQSRVQEIDYVASRAGPQAEFLLTGKFDTGEANAGDLCDAEAALLAACGDDPYVQERVGSHWDTKVDTILRDNFPVLQALACEFMTRGTIHRCDPSPSDIERRYGVGFGGRALTARQHAAARRRLAEYHPTPELLAKAIPAPVLAYRVPVTSSARLWNTSGV